jgi:S1-C subfamily serine protease
VTAEIADSLNLQRPSGALVGTVSPRSPASRAGLKTGDVIVAIDGQIVDDPNAFDYRFTTKPLGHTAQLGVLRGGRETRVAVTLETAPDTPREEVVIRARSPFQGSKVANLSPALAEEMRLEASAEGVVITDVAENSLARNFGFQRGDRILTVNNDRIARTRDLERVSGQQNRLWRITIERAGKRLSVVLGG